MPVGPGGPGKKLDKNILGAARQPFLEGCFGEGLFFSFFLQMGGTNAFRKHSRLQLPDGTLLSAQFEIDV